MRSLCITPVARNYAFAFARCLMIMLLAGALLSPVSLNTVNTEPAKASIGVGFANSKTVKILSVAEEDADKPHLMAASYYSLQSGMKATLTLNNKAPRTLEVQPTLFSLAGERLDVAPVTVEPTSFRVVDISELAAGAAPIFDQGSLQLFYRGTDLTLGAQVKMIDSDHSLIFDEQLVEPAAMFSSSRLEGVWWLPSRHCEMSLVLSNTTESPLLVNAVVDGAAPKQKAAAAFALTPHETRIVDLQRDIIGNAGPL
jgi:P pilus assembly chaperone PapD